MSTTSRLLTAAVILGGLVAYGSLNSNAATGPEFIRITDRQFSYKRVDVGAPGRSPGDQEIVYDKLFNRKITPKPIGSAGTDLRAYPADCFWVRRWCQMM